MDLMEVDDQAEKYAAARSPMPKYEPGTAGLTIGVLAAFAASTFCTLAGMDPQSYSGTITLTAIGFGGPVWLYFRSQENAHYKCKSEEFARLRQKADAQSEV